MKYRELTNEQRRQWLDFMQIDSEHRLCKKEWEHSFVGSMRWLKRKGREYLHTKKGLIEKSLGPRSPKTEDIYDAFMTGRTKHEQRLESLESALNKMAPVNRAMGLNRVPKLSSQILRSLDKEGLLGSHLVVIGTNALWAYESTAGVQIFSDLVATMDADFLWDPRLSLKLVPMPVGKKGILKLLQDIDQTFQKRGKNDYCAINQSGFAVDIVRPEDRQFFLNTTRDQLTSKDDDLKGAPIFGLQWLINCPKFEATLIGEDGLSVRLVTVDPRAFALHKAWISDSLTRDPIKAKRDKEQATLIGQLANTFLNLKFSDDDLRALPKKLRNECRF